MPFKGALSGALGFDIGNIGKRQSAGGLAMAGGGAADIAPIEIHTHLNLDGREIGVAVNNYNRFNQRSS